MNKCEKKEEEEKFTYKRNINNDKNKSRRYGRGWDGKKNVHDLLVYWFQIKVFFDKKEK